MGNKTARNLLAACLAMTFVLLGPGRAFPRPLFEDSPGRPGAEKRIHGGTVEGSAAEPSWKSSRKLRDATGRDGEGPGAVPDYVEYSLAPGRNIALGRGALELTVVRTSPERPPDDLSLDFNTLFDFVRPDNSGALAVLVAWDANGRDWIGSSSFIEILGPPGLWGQVIPLGRKVRQGEKITLGFTWGDGPGRVYVDGKEVAAYLAWPRLKQAVRTLTLAEAAQGADRLRLGISRRGPQDNVWRNPMAEGTYLRVAAFDTPGDVSRIPAIASLTDDAFKVAGISGKLVAGETVAVTLTATPGGKASFDMGAVKGIAMEEVPAREAAPGAAAVAPGTYAGSYTIRPGDDYVDGYVVGHFVSSDNVTAEPVSSASKWTIDTKPVVTFAMDKKDLPADSATKARVKLVAKDANGNAVKGRHLKLTLATTDEYTGTVGAGDFGQEVGASVETRWKGETDSWGEVEFEYKAGFAAKTVILTAKDLDSGGVSVDYVTSYKEASIDIALTAPVSRAAGRRGLQYIVKVEASRTELTADGRSRSVIRATVLDPNGSAVANDPVVFALSSENGSLRTIRGTTDSSGVATAEYVAGKKIGIVVVTATASLRGASGSVSIILLSDAPAKIYLKAKPEKLPADGFSRADLSVKVTDINDNPNKDTKVEFKIAKGGGKLDYAERTTDRYGDADNRYVAGTTPGVASIVATVRSKVPTEGELAKAKNVLFAPYSADGDEIRVEKWLKKKGDTFVKGEALVEYSVGRSRATRVIAAPCDGKLGDLLVEYWDTAEVGETLAILEPSSAR